MKNSGGSEEDRNEADRNSGAHSHDGGQHDEGERDRRFRPGKVEILQVNETTDYGSSDEEERQQRDPSDQERRQPDADNEGEVIDPDDRVPKAREQSLPERAWQLAVHDVMGECGLCGEQAEKYGCARLRMPLHSLLPDSGQTYGVSLAI